MTRRSQLESASLMLLAIGLWGSCSKPTAAQHLDVLFSYVDEKIEIQQQPDPRGLVYAGDFPTSGIERQFTTLPGFASETDVGLGIGGGDEIVYNVLDNLLFWDGNDFALPSNGTQIRVENNPPSLPDTIVTATSGELRGSFSPPVNRIAAAGPSGDYHRDLAWFLEPNSAPSPPPPEGAYGLKLTLSTDEPGIGDSDPLLFVFNFGLDAVSFDAALGAFAELLAPELPGDYNGNGIVDAPDFTLWRDSFGDVGDNLAADGNGNGLIDAPDYNVWRDNFGVVTGATIPEPSTLVFLITAACSTTLREGIMGVRKRAPTKRWAEM